MHHLIRSNFLLIWLLFPLLKGTAWAQSNSIVASTENKQLAKDAVQSVYNWDFEAASNYAKTLEERLPEHPAAPFLEALILYWQNIPFDFESEAYQQHMQQLEVALERTEGLLKEDKESLEAKFFKTSIRSIQIRSYDNNGQIMKSVGAAKQIYSLIMDGIEERDDFIEYYFPVGLYNYYREYYPEAYPVYKPFMFFFKSGDKEQGLQQMDYAVKNAIFTKPEALGYLAYIQYRCEENPQAAFRYMRQLNSLYPNNLHYLCVYVEALVLEGKFVEAEMYMPQLLQSERDFFSMAGWVFQGMITEKRDKDLVKAVSSYHKARGIAEGLAHPYAANLKTYLYLGLSKYYMQQGEQQKAKDFYKDARSHDQYDYVKGSGYKPNE